MDDGDGRIMPIKSIKRYWGDESTTKRLTVDGRIYDKRLTLQTIMMFFLNSSTSGLLFIISSSSCTGRPTSGNITFAQAMPTVETT